ncbi:hypothetical protein J6590_030731 [Homalodisca vitripennis]|nr:hypothetical protein J6590_030731 [Homalodisca vitripennis]
MAKVLQSETAALIVSCLLKDDSDDCFSAHTVPAIFGLRCQLTCDVPEASSLFSQRTSKTCDRQRKKILIVGK